MLRFLLPLLLIPGLAFSQTTPRTSAAVMVVDVASKDVLAANNIDDFVPANFAGRIAFALLVHEWVALNATPLTNPVPGAESMTVEAGLREMLDDGRRGEMARATLAAMIGYTPASMTEAMSTLMTEMGIQTRGFQVQRSSWGGPEWAGSLTVRDMGRLAIALDTFHGDTLGTFVAGAGLQCMSLATTEKTSTRMLAVVSGAASSEGCEAAARSAMTLTDDRLTRGTRLNGPVTAATELPFD